jgi:hypothetical protein
MRPRVIQLDDDASIIVGSLTPSMRMTSSILDITGLRRSFKHRRREAEAVTDMGGFGWRSHFLHTPKEF